MGGGYWLVASDGGIWSSPPGKPVSWAVEPTSTKKIVSGGSDGMFIARSCLQQWAIVAKRGSGGGLPETDLLRTIRQSRSFEARWDKTTHNHADM
jgi:hypothetical protein